MRDVALSGETIRLGQLLKLAGLVGSGADVKPLLALGVVSVDGEVETRRGRQIVPGDVVAVDEEELLITWSDVRGEGDLTP